MEKCGSHLTSGKLSLSPLSSFRKFSIFPCGIPWRKLCKSKFLSHPVTWFVPGTFSQNKTIYPINDLCTLRTKTMHNEIIQCLMSILSHDMYKVFSQNKPANYGNQFWSHGMRLIHFHWSIYRPVNRAIPIQSLFVENSVFLFAVFVWLSKCQAVGEVFS